MKFVVSLFIFIVIIGSVADANLCVYTYMAIDEIVIDSLIPIENPKDFVIDEDILRSAAATISQSMTQ